MKQGSVHTATELATSGKNPQLETMFQEACSSLPPKMLSLLQELHALGRYPKRYKQPASKMEKESDALAKKLAMARSSFTPAVQKYVEELRSTSTATEHAQQAQGLMQQVRALGRMPKEYHEPKECRLASPLLLPRKTWGGVPPVILGMRPGGGTSQTGPDTWGGERSRKS